jgi:hypothetical protein
MAGKPEVLVMPVVGPSGLKKGNATMAIVATLKVFLRRARGGGRERERKRKRKKGERYRNREKERKKERKERGKGRTRARRKREKKRERKTKDVERDVRSFHVATRVCGESGVAPALDQPQQHGGPNISSATIYLPPFCPP